MRDLTICWSFKSQWEDSAVCKKDVRMEESLTEDGTDKKKRKQESNEENQDEVLFNQRKSDGRWYR